MRLQNIQRPTVVSIDLMQSQRLFRDDELNALLMLGPSKCDAAGISDGEYTLNISAHTHLAREHTQTNYE